MIHSETIANISAALSAAQGELEHADKAKDNTHFRSKYAALDGVVDTIKPVLAKHGLAVVQGFMPSETGVTLETMIVHESGEWIRDEGLFVPADKSNAQGFGSAATYSRRYALMAMLGVAPSDDDDGNAASANVGSAPTSKPQPKAHPMAELVSAEQAEELAAAAIATGMDEELARRKAKNTKKVDFVTKLKQLKGE